MIEYHKQLLEIAMEELSIEASRQLEEAIWHIILEEEGLIPDLEEIRKAGRIVRCAEGEDRYTEFQWRGVPQFRQRVKFNLDKGRVECRLDYAPR